jgi:hypothetical protein
MVRRFPKADFITALKLMKFNVRSPLQITAGAGISHKSQWGLIKRAEYSLSHPLVADCGVPGRFETAIPGG